MSTTTISTSFSSVEDPMDLNPIKRNIMNTGSYHPIPMPPPPLPPMADMTKTLQHDSLLTPVYSTPPSNASEHGSYVNTPITPQKKMRFSNSPQKTSMKRVSFHF